MGLHLLLDEIFHLTSNSRWSTQTKLSAIRPRTLEHLEKLCDATVTAHEIFSNKKLLNNWCIVAFNYKCSTHALLFVRGVTILAKGVWQWSVNGSTHSHAALLTAAGKRSSSIELDIQNNKVISLPFFLEYTQLYWLYLSLVWFTPWWVLDTRKTISTGPRTQGLLRGVKDWVHIKWCRISTGCVT